MPEKAPPVVHEFWLSSTITECTIDDQAQTVKAKFLSKWHFKDSEFANKVKRGERKLQDESGNEVMKPEEVSELLEKGDMLRGYMLKMGVEDLALYPYDKHVLPFALETRSWKHQKKDHVWKLCNVEPK